MRWTPKLILTALWTASGTALYLVLPLAAPVILVLAVVVPALWYPGWADGNRPWRWSLPIGLLVVAAGYLLANSYWSLTPVVAYRSAATLLVSAGVLAVLTAALPALEDAPVRAISVGFYAGYALAALFLCLEILDDHQLHLRIFRLIPGIAPTGRSIVVSDGHLVGLQDYYLNHSMAALAFLAWPVLMVASRLALQWGGRVLLLMCLSPAPIAIFASAHETSKVALIGSALVWLVHLVLPRFTKPLLPALWVGAFIAVIPAAQLAYHQGLQRSEWLPPSAQHRVVIWGVTSSKVAEAPVFGSGVGTARELGHKDLEKQSLEPGTPFRQSTGWHAHNVYLQAWFETGAVGVVLMCAIGLLVLRGIGQAQQPIRGALYSAFAANALLGAFSFSLWANWFLSSLVLSAILGMLAWRLVQDRSSWADHALTQSQV